MNKVMLMLLLIIFIMDRTSCILGIGKLSADPYPYSFYQCVASKGYNKIMIIYQLYFFNSTLLQWRNAKNAGLVADFVYFPCREENSTQIAQKIIQLVP